MRTPIPRLLFAALLLALAPCAWADGGGILLQQQDGASIITVFGLPSPLRAGPADISVMVQDSTSKDPVMDAGVRVAATRIAAQKGADEVWLPPCCSMDKNKKSFDATHGQAQNKLLYATRIPISREGAWRLIVEVQRGNKTQYCDGTIKVGPPVKPLAAYWPLLLFPPLAVGGFALNRSLKQRPKSAV